MLRLSLLGISTLLIFNGYGSIQVPVASQPKSLTSHTSQNQPELRLEFDWIQKHQKIVIGTGVPIATFFLYLFVLRVRPLWLLLLPSEFTLPRTSVKLSPEILQFLKYRPRVLDAWVAKRITQVRKEFEERYTVKKRRIHVSVPVSLAQESISELTPKDLHKLFQKHQFRLLILGEGGSGKTSIACQIARWAMSAAEQERLCQYPMIPVLIEDEIDETIFDSIAHQLKNLRDEEKPITEELLKHLLRRRRILVIVDHLSEMSKESQKAIRLRDANSPINALILTSRILGIVGKEVTQTILKPLRVSGKQLSIFMDAYLSKCGKRDLFEDAEYFSHLSRLSQIVTNNRDITVLFAKLYADQMIVLTQEINHVELPNNIPDLMLSYLNELNRTIQESKVEDYIIQRKAQVIAWECIKETFKPETAEKEKALAALCASNKDMDVEATRNTAKLHLDYLENRLFLIRTISPLNKRIRFSLDPLAEYLAGLYIVNCFRDNKISWKNFVEEVSEKPGTLEEIRGFLLAVRDCCLARKAQIEIPNFAIEELGKLAGLDLARLEEERLSRRVRRLTSELFVPEVRDRQRAAQELSSIYGEMGTARKPAISALLRALMDEEYTVCSDALLALSHIGGATEPVLRALLIRFDHTDERIRFIAFKAFSQHTYSQSRFKGLLANFNNESVLQKLLAKFSGKNDSTEDVSQHVLNGILARLKEAGNYSEIRNEAAEMFCQLSKDSKFAAEGLLTLLVDDNVEINSSIVQAFNGLNKASEHVVKSLSASLNSENKTVNLRAAKVIRLLNRSSDFLVSKLILLLEDRNPEISSTAATELRLLNNSSESVLQALALQHKNPHSIVRASVAEALGKLSNSSESIQQVLMILLKDREDKVSRCAAIALVESSDGSELSVRNLLSLFREMRESARSGVAPAFRQKHRESHLLYKVLFEEMNDINSDMRIFAIDFLRECNDWWSKSVIASLKELLSAQELEVRSRAKQTLQALRDAEREEEEEWERIYGGMGD